VKDLSTGVVSTGTRWFWIAYLAGGRFGRGATGSKIAVAQDAERLSQGFLFRIKSFLDQ
jgi:hypothetical protein